KQTAQPIPAPRSRAVQCCDELDERDYGGWSGRAFDDLARDPQWQLWNCKRATTCPPNGESMLALQQRMLRLTSELARAHCGETVICVSHAEPIRALMLHISGLSLDNFDRVDIPPGSITRIRVESKPPLRG